MKPGTKTSDSMNPGPVIPDVEDKKQDSTPRKRRRSGSDPKISSIESYEAGYETSDESGNSFYELFFGSVILRSICDQFIQLNLIIKSMLKFITSMIAV